MSNGNRLKMMPGASHACDVFLTNCVDVNVLDCNRIARE